MYNYREMYKLLRNFHELGKTEVGIMDYLMQRDIYYGGFTDLTKAIGYDRGYESNLRKAMLRLEKAGFIHIVRKYYEDEAKGRRNSMTACFIIDGWMDLLLKKGIKDLQEVKAPQTAKKNEENCQNIL